ncbi:hypothetical protein [Paenibacillus xerothermodurans]|uniref:hypothetical protein n=1 Tax=Paenibacillus xerothermodurans TaxID=1977292 RepID=UPI001403ECE1|nr:hypothetical protein [Paenibacillus xerothermodurans]
MKLSLVEVEGDKPVSEWLARRLKDFVYEKSGLEVSVQLQPLPDAGSRVGGEAKSDAAR